MKLLCNLLRHYSLYKTFWHTSVLIIYQLSKRVFVAT